MPYEWNSSQDVEKCALDLVSSSSTRTNTIQTIALASKGGQKFLQDPLPMVDGGLGVMVMVMDMVKCSALVRSHLIYLAVRSFGPVPSQVDKLHPLRPCLSM